jgi:hypothetical protein
MVLAYFSLKERHSGHSHRIAFLSFILLAPSSIAPWQRRTCRAIPSPTGGLVAPELLSEGGSFSAFSIQHFILPPPWDWRLLAGVP